MGVIDSMLTDTFTIYRRSRVANGEGGWLVTWVEMGTVWGHLQPVGGAERQVASQESREITHVLFTRAGVTGVTLARGDRATGVGVTVDVLGVREPSYAGHHWENDCRLVQAEVDEEPGS